MPEGSICRYKGMLLRQRGGLILQMDEGIRWRLHSEEELDYLIGEHVGVEGIQINDDVLEVTSIKID